MPEAQPSGTGLSGQQLGIASQAGWWPQQAEGSRPAPADTVQGTEENGRQSRKGCYRASGERV